MAYYTILVKLLANFLGLKHKASTLLSTNFSRKFLTKQILGKVKKLRWFKTVTPDDLAFFFFFLNFLLPDSLGDLK